MPPILTSGLANYMPPRHWKYPNEIWIISGLGRLRFISCLLHEIGHWIIEFLPFPFSRKIHDIYDWRPQWVRDRWERIDVME